MLSAGPHLWTLFVLFLWSAVGCTSLVVPQFANWSFASTAPFPATWDGACAFQSLQQPLLPSQSEPYLYILGGGDPGTNVTGYFDVWESTDGAQSVSGWTPLIENN